MAPVPSRISPKHEEDIYSGPNDLFVEGFWISYHPALGIQHWDVMTRVPDWFQFDQCSPSIRKTLQDYGYSEERSTTVVADGPIREGSLLTVVDSESVDSHTQATSEAPTEVAECQTEVAESPFNCPSSKAYHMDPVEIQPLLTPEGDQKLKKNRKKPHKKKKPAMANNNEAVDPPANHPPSPSAAATITVADNAEALDPLAHPLSSPLPPLSPSATQASMELLPAAQAKKRRPSKKAQRKKKLAETGAAEAQSSGPAEATTSTAPEIGSQHTLEDVKTSLGAVVPETGHKNSDNTNKTDVMPAIQTTAVESYSLTASAPELQDRQGPCIVDTDKWRKRCIEKMQAELAARDAVPAVPTLQQLDFGEMSLSPIITMPKSFSEPASPNIVKPAPLDACEPEMSTMIGERPGQRSTTTHFEGGASPIYAVGSSNANQPLTYCRVLPNCTVHPDGVCDVGGGPRCSCCCAHQPLHCVFFAYPIEGGFTFGPWAPVV